MILCLRLLRNRQGTDDDDDGDGDDDDADDVQFNGLVIAEHCIAMDDESVYVCEDSEVDPSNIVPMRCPPDIDPDVSTTGSWYIASAAPNVVCASLWKYAFHTFGLQSLPTSSDQR